MKVEDVAKRKREAEEMGDAMKSLENRTLDSKREMDIMAALDEMKSMKVRVHLKNIHATFYFSHQFIQLNSLLKAVVIISLSLSLLNKLNLLPS